MNVACDGRANNKIKCMIMWNCGVIFIVCVMIKVSISSTLKLEKIPSPYLEKNSGHTQYNYEEHNKDGEITLALLPKNPPSTLPSNYLGQPSTSSSPASLGKPEKADRPDEPGGLSGPTGPSGSSNGRCYSLPGTTEGPGEGSRLEFTQFVNERSKCPDDKTCARKCCPEGLGWDLQNNSCSSLPVGKEFNPKIWVGYSSLEGKRAKDELHFLEGRVICSMDEALILVTNATSVFRLQLNGKFVVESYFAAGPELEFDINKYCIDWFLTGNETKRNAFICYKQNNFKIKWHYLMTGSCMLVICFMMLLRVIVFAWVPELRTLHGITLMAYLMSFLVGFLLLGCKMLLMYQQKVNRNMCFFLSLVAYFSILSAFFWRNVMCYDIWWTFSGNRALSGQSSNSRKRLYVYCVYAFGGPVALTSLLCLLESSAYSKDYTLMPKIWIHGCNSLYGYSKLIYFYGPIMILFVANMILFTLTALKIAASKKETKRIFKSQESCTHDQRNESRRYKIFVKLFAAMVFLEVNWILEIITIFYPDTEIVLHIIDIYNVGVIFFTIINFLCQKQTWKMIIMRFKQITSGF